MQAAAQLQGDAQPRARRPSPTTASVAALRPNDADVMADLADLLAATGNGGLDGEPIQLVEQARWRSTPNQVKALALQAAATR